LASDCSTSLDDNGSRGVLRGLDVLRAVAQRRDGATFTQLREDLQLPKASLHRLLRSLEQERYLSQRSGNFFLGAESTRLAGLVTRATHAEEFPASVVPVAEWLAMETGETIVVGVLSERMTEVIYVHVINSDAPLRITVPIGNRRPLYSAASGKIILAYLPHDFQQRYLAETSFEKITRFTSIAADMPAILQAARHDGIVADLNGSFVGVSGIASPGFDAAGNIFCAISVVGPLDRIDADYDRFRLLTREAGDRVSRTLGYLDEYPPASQ
jgi:DNA-binding IclR family transcriptional regulator